MRYSLATILLVLIVSSGCTAIRATNTPRTGTEQLLLTNTWDQSLATVDFRPLCGKKVYLDLSYLEVIDQGWASATLMQTLLRNGVVLESEEEDAELIFIASCAAYGTDERSTQLGSDGSSLGGLTLGINGHLYLDRRQSAVVKVAFFAYERESSRLVWQAGPIINQNGVDDRQIFATRPQRKTTVNDIDWQFKNQSNTTWTSQRRESRQRFHNRKETTPPVRR